MGNIEYVSPVTLKPNPRNAHTHPKKQIRQLADLMALYGFTVPVLADENWVILAGHGRVEAAILRGLKKIPVIRLLGLSEAQKRALVIADNKIAENAGWDRQRLAIELPELAEILVEEGLDISITGFEAAEIDQLITDFEDNTADLADSIRMDWLSHTPVSQPGDLWQLGSHRLLCGDARDPGNLNRLLGGELAAMAFIDSPYNLKIKSVVGRGRTKHREFAMASGEMVCEEYVDFLRETLGNAATHSRAGALHYVCMDWRHQREMIDAGRQTYGAQVNLVVWVKSNAGQGSFYRSQHELIGVFRVGEEPHLNNIELGRHGRSRSNVWRYAGVNGFRAGRMDDLSAHPTAKPPGRPPKEYQWKPGQSGNPKGAKRKARSLIPELKQEFERVLSQKLKVTQGDRERFITRWVAGLEQLSIQYAKGDRHARRDVFYFAERLGVDLLKSKASDDTISTDHQAILDAYVERRTREKALSAPSPVLAPPDLLDDAPDEAEEK